MMALRHRLTILTAATVGITVVLISFAAYVALRSELRGQVDDSLDEQYQLARDTGRLIVRQGLRFPDPSARSGGPAGLVQVITISGDIYIQAQGDLPVPVDGAVRAIDRHGQVD